MTMITKLRARVSPEAISKVTRIFNGTLDDIFNELFQNARRAGAGRITVTADHAADACLITVSDDGAGIADPVDLISLGASDWPDERRAREDPAGMGFFSLAGLDTVVSSRSADGAFSLAIKGDAWTGEADIDVLSYDGPRGTTIAFRFDPQPDGKLERCVEAAARFLPLAVSYNGKDLARADFLADAHKVIEREGFRIGVFRDRHSPHVATLNFHGVTLKHAFPVVKEVHHTQWSVQVDVIDAPELVLVLPARKEIYRNAALDRLVALCREAIFSVIREEPFHRLGFENWIEASLHHDDFPQAARQLPLWYPTLARDSYREVPRFADLEPGAAIYDDTDSFDAVTFGRALRRSNGGELHRLGGPEPRAFYEPITNFIGYTWYDALAAFVRTGERYTFDGGAPADETDAVTLRPDAITIELTDQHDRRLDLETDFAILDDPDSWGDPDCARIALTRTTALGPDDLTDLIIDAVFSPSDDSDADSYDTQETRFRHDAAVRAHAILEGEDAAILAGIRMAFADRVAWRIPHGRTLRLSWSSAASGLSLDPAQEGPAQ
ncbi:sensor histidine kinase [Novosphingobium sp. ERN07]|uniref:ATP-binding protein n=1 Tax=Novosphingobium sp. ERN07 TaxID=2726187 RepID=UPI001456E55F|nr:ATP-binding protein [Novosphingobium sp. ERN07]NLR72087.1 sensor histidine kinase [Novosphingobium sp. ERN07]